MPKTAAWRNARKAARTRTTTFLVSASQVTSPANASTSRKNEESPLRFEHSVSLSTSTRIVAGQVPGHCRLQLTVAVEVGFEPTEGLPPHTLSRRAPSATRRLHRR